MKHRFLSLRLALIASLALVGAAFAENKLPDIKVDAAPLERSHENSFAPVVEKVGPSVVTLSISKNEQVGGRGRGNPLADDPFSGGSSAFQTRMRASRSPLRKGASAPRRSASGAASLSVPTVTSSPTTTSSRRRMKSS